MNSHEVSGARTGGLFKSTLLVFSATATLLSALVASLVWLTGELWFMALIPAVPGILAAIFSAVLGQNAEFKDLLKSCVNGKVGGRWIAISTLTLPVIAGLSLAIYAFTGDAGVSFSRPRIGMIFAALPLALLNELGWRGFAPQHLRIRHGLFVKSVVIGLLWATSVAPIYMFDMPAIDITAFQMFLVLIPLSTLMFWLKANTRSILMPAAFLAFGVIILALLPILPGDSAQGVTFWLVIGFLWLVAVAVVGHYGTDGLDHSIYELPADELPVRWDKVMPKNEIKKSLAPPSYSQRFGQGSKGLLKRRKARR